MSNEQGLRAALEELYKDNHRWSVRPCATCAAITSATGIPFGCDKMAGRLAANPAEQVAKQGPSAEAAARAEWGDLPVPSGDAQPSETLSTAGAAYIHAHPAAAPASSAPIVTDSLGMNPVPYVAPRCGDSFSDGRSACNLPAVEVTVETPPYVPSSKSTAIIVSAILERVAKTGEHSGIWGQPPEAKEAVESATQAILALHKRLSAPAPAVEAGTPFDARAWLRSEGYSRMAENITETEALLYRRAYRAGQSAAPKEPKP